MRLSIVENFIHKSYLIEFNLDFYTEVQDLSYLENSLTSSSPARFSALNMAIISLIEDFSLVGFETLAVEVSFGITCLYVCSVIDYHICRTNIPC